MQLVETETSPLGYASQNKESAVFAVPSASAVPPAKTSPQTPRNAAVEGDRDNPRG